MSITRDQTGTGVAAFSGTSVVVTWATAPAAGSKVLIFISTTGTVSGVKDNGVVQTTFTQDAFYSSTHIGYQYVFRGDGISLPASGNYAVTLTLSGTGDYYYSCGRSYLGVAAGGPVATNDATGTSQSASTGSVTPTAASSLVFGGCGTDSSATESFTLTTSGASTVYTSTSGAYIAGSTADNIVTGTSAQSLAWTIASDTPDWQGTGAVYSAAATTAARVPQLMKTRVPVAGHGSLVGAGGAFTR